MFALTFSNIFFSKCPDIDCVFFILLVQANPQVHVALCELIKLEKKHF